jgi:hypothetical protein
MTIEQKAKAYDKAIEKIKYVMEHGVSPTLNKEDLEDIFTELQESEDELTRKDLLEYVKHCVCDRDVCKEEKDKWIAWLEKQGKQKPTLRERYENIAQSEWFKRTHEGMSVSDEESKWSEETDDDAWLNDIISKVESGCTLNGSEIKWLKSIKDKINIHYWTEKEIEPIISDYLRGAEHYGGMIGRLRCLKPKSLEKQGEQKPKWSDRDEHYWILCVECVKECATQEREDFSKTIDWLNSIKQRIEEL